MADRLSIITTRTGDQGTTGLGDGSRVNKTDERIHALGDVDELNSVLGLVVTHLQELPECHDYLAMLNRVQHALFDLGSELAVPGFKQLQAEQVADLDEQIASLNARLPALKEFILPGGSRAAAQTHVARSVCRRAERSVVALTELGPYPQQYLNRLSDMLFILARCVNQSLSVNDVMWQRQN